MSQKASKPTSAAAEFDKAWGRLIAATLVAGGHGRPEGEGWIDKYEFAEKTKANGQPGMSAARASTVLMERHRAGELELKKGKIGRAWFNFYRPKQ